MSGSSLENNFLCYFFLLLLNIGSTSSVSETLRIIVLATFCASDKWLYDRGQSEAQKLLRSEMPVQYDAYEKF